MRLSLRWTFSTSNTLFFLKLCIGKVHESLYAHTDQILRHGLHGLFGNRQYCHFRVVFINKLTNFGIILNHKIVYGSAYHILGVIKNAYELKAAAFKLCIGGKGSAHMTGAYHNGGVAPIQTENVGDLRSEHFNVISVSLLPEAAEAVKILPYLRGGNPHSLAELLRGNPFRAAFIKVGQVPVISGQTIDNRTRYFLPHFHFSLIYDGQVWHRLSLCKIKLKYAKPCYLTRITLNQL